MSRFEDFSELKPDSIESSVLLVDDEQSVLDPLATILTNYGYSVTALTSPRQALSLVARESFDIIVTDLKMPELDGLAFLKELKAQKNLSTVVVMSAYGTIPLALEAMKYGAYDYISKPFNADEIIMTLRKAEERERLRQENSRLRAAVTKRYSFSSIVGESPSMAVIFETIKKIADYKTTVMIYGESGTGKELVARAIHHNSIRRHKRFVAINCGAIPENLLESELFGHRRGAFTDATKDKKGLFEEADGGTLLLDEVGELPMHLQVKLLRVLQENEIRPVGENQTRPIDVRVIAATLRDLEQDVIEGRFRDDLYYRLNVITFRLPALRERPEDLMLLVEHFMEKHGERLGVGVKKISKAAVSKLLEHSWPGNVRELENCIERAMILCDGATIEVEHLPKPLITHASSTEDEMNLSLLGENLSIKVHSKRLEENLIKRALLQTGGNRTHAAKLLEISHRTLLYKLKEYELVDFGSIDLEAD